MIFQLDGWGCAFVVCVALMVSPCISKPNFITNAHVCYLLYVFSYKPNVYFLLSPVSSLIVCFYIGTFASAQEKGKGKADKS